MRLRLIGLLLSSLFIPVFALAAEPIIPTKPIDLLAPEQVGSWESYLKETGRHDPEQVFTFKEGELHISGKDRGYVATRDTYRDYRLTVEYKWGERRSDKSKYVRNSGVLLHAIGPHGSASPWMTSIEVQLAQGCEGDLIVIRGRDDAGEKYPATISSRTRLDSDKRTRWDPEGAPTVYSGKQFWWNKHDPAFEELLDTRGRWDVASKFGEWTKLECVCAGDKIAIKINGVDVNACYDVRPAAGKILLQNEGYELWFRKCVIGPLDKPQ